MKNYLFSFQVSTHPFSFALYVFLIYTLQTFFTNPTRRAIWKRVIGTEAHFV